MVLEEKSIIKKGIVGFYEGLLGSKSQCRQHVNKLFDRKGHILNEMQRRGLVDDVFDVGIDEVMMSINPDSASKIEGMNGFFFRKTCSIAKAYIYHAIRACLKHCI